MAVFPNGINVKIEWLVTLENLYPQWLVSKKSYCQVLSTMMTQCGLSLKMKQ